ncbi:hypothetical protein AAII07_43665 [Microvirga sp. 0TCS3.31]
MATLVLSSNEIFENARAGDLVGTLSVSGNFPEVETFTFNLNDERFQIINGNQLVVKSGGFDYEGPQKQFPLDILVIPSGNTVVDGTRVLVDIKNANEAPTDIEVTGGSVPDTAIPGTTVATLKGIDPDKGNQLSYTIVESMTDPTPVPHPYFEIRNGEIVVARELGDEHVGSHSLFVRVSDGDFSYTKEVTLTVTDANELPEITPDIKDVLEGAPKGTVVATIKVSDPEGLEATAAIYGSSNNYFALVDKGDGTYDVIFQPANDRIKINPDIAAHTKVTVTVSDGENSFNEVIDLNVIDNLEPEPTFAFLEIAKNTPGDTLVGTLMPGDPEEQAVMVTLSGDNADLFTLVKNADGTYGVFVKQSVTLDYSDDAQHSFTVTVSDGINLPFEETFELVFGSFAPRVTDAPPINVKEGVGGNTVVAKFTVTDPDDDAIDCMLSPESEALFDLVDHGNGNYDVVVREGIKLDYENSSHHVVKMTVSDGSNTLSRNFTVNLSDEIDVFTGTAGRDVIKGLAGNDTLNGDTGNDTLYGGTGKDVLNGGGGQDVFVFDSKPNKKTNLDKVADFSVADDSIWLENKIFTKLGKKGSETAPAQIKKAFFVVGDKAKDKDDYLIYNKKAGKLYYDADGSGSKAALEIATLSKKLATTHKDFFVI